MNRKVLIVCIFSFTLSIVISCFSYYTSYDTRIESIVTTNLIYQDSCFKMFEDEDIQYQQYGLMCFCTLNDSITSSGKHHAFLENLSLIHDAYAYDPALTEDYSLKDSIQALRIQSLYDFNDVSTAESDLLQYFNIGYVGFYKWNFRDSITAVQNINNIEQLNHILSWTDRSFDDISLILTLKEKPKYEKQQFVVNLLFKSGHSLIDTTKVINLK
jgi:hypothetical protein